VKAGNISIRESEGTQFMQEYSMRDKVKSIRKIKIYNISLTLTTGTRSQDVEKCCQIGNCRFCSGEAMLIWIKFSIMQNMIINNEFKQFREIVENLDGFVVAHGGVIASFKYWYNISCFPCSSKILSSQA
jgi:hypothetical protein